MKKQMLVAAAALTALLAFGAETRPNFLIFLSDDVGWGDFQCYNPQGKIPTPNVDKLAQAGMRFTDAHTPAALCAPTRYTVATGNYGWVDLWCGDSESSVDGLADFFMGTSDGCTGFND